MASNYDDWGIPNESAPTQEQPNPQQNAIDVINDLDELDNITNEFDQLYSDVVNGSSDMQLFSSNVQRIEINNLNPVLTGFGKSVETSEEKEATEDLDNLLNTNSNDILKIFNNGNISNNRKQIYELYNEISEINPIAYRMLRVYIDNILIKNIQNKQFINIIENDSNELMVKLDNNVKKNISNFMKTFLIYFDIQNKLKNTIIHNTLKYGDFYLEVIDLSPVTKLVDTRRELITENITFYQNEKNITTNCNLGYLELPPIEKEIINENYTESNNEQFLNILKSKESIQESDMRLFNDIYMDNINDLNSQGYQDDNFDIKDIKDLNFDIIKNIYLKFISPTQVIKLEKDGINFGYLIIEELNKGEEADEINLYKRFADDDDNTSNKETLNNKKTTNEIIDKFSKEILSKLKEHLVVSNNFIDELPEELAFSLKVILYEKIKKKSKLKFRLVESNDLINFHTSIDKFAPYATSIFDPIVLPVKLYTIALLSSVISRLSRASVVRKWNIEVGKRRNHSQVVQNVQKELKTKNISYDDLGSMKNISQIMTDFRDIATVSKNGQKYIDMEVMPMHDRALPINDLGDLRNELIASTGIPSVFLNIGENIEQRETLVNLNITFANSITTYQSYIEDSLNDLINTVFQKVLKANNKPSKIFNITQYMKFTLNAPVILQLQNSEAVISSIGNLIGTLKQAGINVDPEELFKLYAPNLPWDKLKRGGEKEIKEQIKEQIMQNISQPPEQP